VLPQGLKPPRGVLLYGPPGTGKTHLAQSLADTSGATLIVVSGPELSSAYHGETESKLRAVFEQAKTRAPCIVVFDEIDAICPRREESGGLVEARAVTTLLTLMDGMEATAKGSNNLARVVVIATTNRPNAIDPALRRPGRFDREIEIGQHKIHRYARHFPSLQRARRTGCERKTIHLAGFVVKVP
jgi:AAA family ATPase